MNKSYSVYFSWTIDHIVWDCPKCDTHNESEDSCDDCLICSNCGFERDTSSQYEMGSTDAEEEIFDYWTLECPNCGCEVENEGDFCEDCSNELGVE